jgi:hypothetical protein
MPRFPRQTIAARGESLYCFAQFLRLKPKHRPWSRTRRQPGQSHWRQLQRKHPVPTCRPAHRWLVGPESRHPNRDERILQWSGPKLDILDMEEFAVMGDVFAAPKSSDNFQSLVQSPRPHPIVRVFSEAFKLGVGRGSQSDAQYRPPARQWSSETNSRAIFQGRRRATGVITRPSLRCSVRAAIAASAIPASTKGMSEWR